MSNINDGGFQLGSKIYDRAKFIIQVVLPALGVLYATIAGTFHFDGTEQVLTVLAAVGLFVGTVMRISASNFSPPPTTSTPVGNFVVTEQADGKKSVALDLQKDPADFIDQDIIAFHLSKQVPSAEVPPQEDRAENVS